MPAERVDELSHLTQALEIKQRRRECGRKGRRGAGNRVVRRAEGDGGMAAVGQLDDDVGALAAADADDRQLLPPEGMMGMRDRHESRRALRERGGALGMCRPRATRSFRRCCG